jgi:hypothetical protein
LSLNWDAKNGKNSEVGNARTRPPAEPLRTCVAIIELAPIRDAVRPEDWPRHRYKIVSFAQHAARTLIGESDTFAIHRCELCILTLGDTTLEIASSTAAAIGHKIVQDLLGVQGVGRVTLAPRVFEMTQLLASELAPQYDVAPDGTGDRLPGMPHSGPHGAPKPDRLARHRRLRPLFGTDGPAEVDVSYHPIWNLESRMVRTFSLVATVRRGAEPPLQGYDALQRPEATQDIGDFDLANVETGLLDLKAAIDAGHESRLLLPLHFETVGSYQGRSELLEIFPSLPASVRQRLSFALFGIPAGVPQGRLHQVHLMLKPLAGDVTAVLSPHTANSEVMWRFAARVRSVGMKRIVVALPDDPTGNIIDRTRAICSRASSMGLEVCVLNLHSGPLAHRLSIAGCTDFGGVLFGGRFEDIPASFAVHSGVFERKR